MVLKDDQNKIATKIQNLNRFVFGLCIYQIILLSWKQSTCIITFVEHYYQRSLEWR